MDSKVLHAAAERVNVLINSLITAKESEALITELDSACREIHKDLYFYGTELTDSEFNSIGEKILTADEKYRYAKEYEGLESVLPISYNQCCDILLSQLFDRSWEKAKENNFLLFSDEPQPQAPTTPKRRKGGNRNQKLKRFFYPQHLDKYDYVLDSISGYTGAGLVDVLKNFTTEPTKYLKEIPTFGALKDEGILSDEEENTYRTAKSRKNN